MVSVVSPFCPACRGAIHHSRSRSWLERVRRYVTRRVPYRCHTCNWRGWLRDTKRRPHGLREIHRELTDAELERLEPDNSKGERS
jgi:hypothetical protein